jgi:C-terminal processing protease CtpA/Prc
MKLENAIESGLVAGMKHLVLDLRNNTGGAICIALGLGRHLVHHLPPSVSRKYLV